MKGIQNGRKFFFILVLIILFTFFITILNAQNTRGIVDLEKHLDRTIEIGKQYLLLIAIDEYEHFSSIQYPVTDTEELRDILMQKYYIDEVYKLYNKRATRANIIKMLTSLKDTLTVKDSLFIYYAGHGNLDEESDTGAWIPYDAEKNPFTQLNWIPNHLIRGIISKMDALHVLLISDSCFSGDILNSVRDNEESPDPSHIPFYKKTYMRTSREVISSGASEVVPDKSEFSAQLKMCLKKNRNPYLDTLTIFNEIKIGVTVTLPLMGDLKATNHQQGGSFIFFLKNADIIPSTGTIHIIANSGGNLFINGNFYKYISENLEVIPGMEPASYNLEIRYTTGDVESQSVTVEKGEIVTTTFLFDPMVPRTPVREKSYIYCSIGFGLPVPVYTMSEFLTIGYNPALKAGYSLKLNSCRVLFGFASGYTVEPVKENYDLRYLMYSIQLAASIEYRTTFLDPFFVFAEAAGGATINIFEYDPGAGKETYMTPTPFIGPCLGIGYNVLPHMNISVYGNFTIIFFTNELYMSITPGIRCHINIP